MSLECFPLIHGPLPERVGTVGGWQVTSYFGGRIDPLTGRPGNHGGEDLAHPGCAGEPLFAVKAGRVSQAWDPSGGGNWTTLYCDDGTRYGYGHAVRFANGVNGTHVTAGTILAYLGTTGASTGAHLHFAYGPTHTSGYADPHDQLVEAANAGRFPGAVGPVHPTSPPSTPTEGFGTMTDDQINAKFAELAQNILILESKLVDTTAQAVAIRVANADGKGIPQNITEILNRIDALSAKIDAIAAK